MFFPVVFLTGLGRFLFTPLALALAVIFAIAVSWLVSMTLVPICCARFLRAHLPAVSGDTAPRTLLGRLAVRWMGRYDGLLRLLLAHWLVVLVAIAALFGDQVKAGAILALLEVPEMEKVVLADQQSRTLVQVADKAGEQVAFAQEALRLARANLQAGTMTVLDVLDVLDDESGLAQARLRHAEAVVRYDQAQIDLLAALGILTAASLAPSP